MVTECFSEEAAFELRPGEDLESILGGGDCRSKGWERGLTAATGPGTMQGCEVREVRPPSPPAPGAVVLVVGLCRTGHTQGGWGEECGWVGCKIPTVTTLAGLGLAPQASGASGRGLPGVQ